MIENMIRFSNYVIYLITQNQLTFLINYIIVKETENIIVIDISSSYNIIRVVSKY
jgi:hypothetical protein